MELRQLKHFVAITETGSISAAARQLHLAQPAISASIKKLEAELNLSLLHRRERGVEITQAGQEFLQHARQILSQARDAKLAMQSLEGLESGEVQIGVPSMLGSYLFPPLVMAFKHRYPALNINIIDSGTRNIRQQLLEGKLEIGIVADLDLTPELDSFNVIREEMVACMASDHPLARKDVITYEDFLEHELVMFRKGYYFHTMIENISRKVGITPKISYISNLLPLIKSLIRQGYAIAPMWQVAIQSDDQIITRPFTEPFSIDLSLAWRHDSYLSRANREFRDFLREQSEKGLI